MEEWYERAIPHAEELHAVYLKERAEEEGQCAASRSGTGMSTAVGSVRKKPLASVARSWLGSGVISY